MENKNIFETGATSLAANNLILSVMSDGKVYQRRIDAARRILDDQGYMRKNHWPVSLRVGYANS